MLLYVGRSGVIYNAKQSFLMVECGWIIAVIHFIFLLKLFFVVVVETFHGFFIVWLCYDLSFMFNHTINCMIYCICGKYCL